MEQFGAAAEYELGDVPGEAPLAGLAHLEASQAARRPFPGSVPPPAGFAPFDPDAALADASCRPGEQTGPHGESDLKNGDTSGPESIEATMMAAIASAVVAVAALGALDAASLDAELLAVLVEGTEQVRRMSDSAATDVAAVIDTTNPFRPQGYFNANTYLKQRAQLSGPEAHRRIQTARMQDKLPEWADAAHAGGRPRRFRTAVAVAVTLPASH